MIGLARALAALLVASACTQAAPTRSDPPPSPTERPVSGGVIVEPIIGDVVTLQPVLARDISSARATELLYEPLIDWDPETGAPRPRLGTWRTSDSRTYEWQLSAATWTDGLPVVAADFLTGMKAIARSKKTTKRPIFGPIEGFDDYAAGRNSEIAGIKLDPVDPLRFTVTLRGPYCPLFRIFGVFPLPSHVFDRYLSDTSGDAIDTAPENDAPAITNGPFRFGEWRRGERLYLERNLGYWRGAPFLEGWEFKLISKYDVPTWAEHFRDGRFSYLRFSPGDQLGERLSAMDNVRVHSTLGADYTYLGWNTRSTTAPALADRRVRQALAYGLDIDAVVRDVLDGAGAKHVSHHLPTQWAHTRGLNSYPYDPQRARQLIESAGYTPADDGYYAKDGRTLAFTLETNANNPVRSRSIQLAADQYALIGIKVTPALVDFAELVDRLTSGAEFEAVMIGWSLTPDPDAYDIWHSSATPARGKRGNNFTRFSDPRVDTALTAGRDGPDCSIPARRAHYEVMNRVLNEEQPYNFGFVTMKFVATPAALRGYRPGAFSSDSFDVHRWWLAPESK